MRQYMLGGINKQNTRTYQQVVTRNTIVYNWRNFVQMDEQWTCECGDVHLNNVSRLGNVVYVCRMGWTKGLSAISLCVVGRPTINTLPRQTVPFSWLCLPGLVCLRFSSRRVGLETMAIGLGHFVKREVTGQSVCRNDLAFARLIRFSSCRRQTYTHSSLPGYR